MMIDDWKISVSHVLSVGFLDDECIVVVIGPRFYIKFMGLEFADVEVFIIKAC